MEIAEKENGKKWLLWLKTAIIIGYFLGTMSFSLQMPLHQLALGSGALFFEEAVLTGVFFYGVTWLYRWVVYDQIKFWDKKTAAMILCGAGLRLFINWIILYTQQGDLLTMLFMYAVTNSFFIAISLIVSIPLLFFAIDGRKWSKEEAPGKPQKWIGRIGAGVCMVSIGVMIVNLCLNTPVEGIMPIPDITNINMLEFITYFTAPQKEVVLSDLNNSLGSTAAAALFLLLWTKTEPGKGVCKAA